MAYKEWKQMWTEFDFNEPYEGMIPEINNVKLPLEYIEFMKEHNGGEGDIGKSWLVLYSIEELEEINVEYEEYLPDGYLIIGSNGGGELFGLNYKGQYFIVPEIIEEKYVKIIGNTINNLPVDIASYWNEMEQKGTKNA